MKTVYIDHLRSEEIEEFQSDIIDSGDSKETALARVRDLRGAFLRPEVQGSIDLNAIPLTDDEGIQYDRMSFTVLSSYGIDGDFWFSGSEFRINLSHYFDEMREIVEEAYAGIPG